MSDPSLLSQVFLQQRPRAAAALLEEFSPEDCVAFLKDMPLEVLVQVIDNMASWPAARTLSLLPAQLSAEILRKLPDAEAETLLRLMTKNQRAVVMAQLPGDTARNLARKLTFPISTVGAWMDSSVPCFTLDSSVNHCLDLVKRRKSHLGGIVIAVDEQHHLAGLVEVERLLTIDGKTLLKDLLNTDTQPLSARATLWEVEHHEGWSAYPSLPVVDRNNTVLGALTHSALRSGTARSLEPEASQMQFSLLAQMGSAFIVAMGGLLASLTGIRTGPDVRSRTAGVEKIGTPGRPQDES
jgi:Mg/Co/Ni transporter MgtE